MKKYITHETIKRMNERTLNGVTDIKISIPKKFKFIGLGLLGLSVCPVGFDLVSIPLSFAFLKSTSLKMVIPNFCFMFVTNFKKVKKRINKGLIIAKYNKSGIRRF